MSVCEHINQIELPEARQINEQNQVIYELLMTNSVCLDCGEIFQFTKEINRVVTFCGEIQLQLQTGCNGIVYADNLKWNDTLKEHVCGKCFEVTAEITVVPEDTLCPCAQTHSKSVFKA